MQTRVFFLCAGLAFATAGTLPVAAQFAPTIVEPPQKESVTEGTDIVLSTTVTGEPVPAVAWYKNGELLFGAEETTLEILNATAEDSGRYHVVASNELGSATSLHARVTVRPNHYDKSVARQWNEENLAAIRIDYPAPTVHSRNLFHVSAAMYDAWRAYADSPATAYMAAIDPSLKNGYSIEEAQNEAISHAAYTVLSSRYRWSPNAEATLASLRKRMEALEYDPNYKSIVGDDPAAVGNRIGATILAKTLYDGSNEHEGYADQTGYIPINAPLIFKLPGINFLADPNQWQPLAFDHLVLQNGIPVGAAVQTFLGPNWGGVTPFALTKDPESGLWADPGPPPELDRVNFPSETDAEFKDAVVEVIEYSSWLDPSDGTLIDVSPASRHNNALGTNDGTGYELNPATGQPYEPNIVLRADYGRILAEFWADGPDSETPPGHWNSVANHVTEHSLFSPRIEGTEEVSALEWDIKAYFALNAALSDAAIACWGAKRYYNYSRPITMIRYLASKGQSSDPAQPSYNERGIPLKEGLIEVITPESSAEGERHEHLSQFAGEIALRSWRGVPENPAVDISGVGWIRAAEWMPFQRDTFVTPPFGAYTSGHSTFSRAAAEVLALLTGSPYFPGGISTFFAKKNAFLEFEVGPAEDVTLTWATYYDAADEAGLSRLYGGIHVRADDFQGRIMGSEIGKSAYAKAKAFFTGEAETVQLADPYQQWAVSIELQLPGLSKPEDKLPDSRWTNMQRFIAGFGPLELREGDLLPLSNLSFDRVSMLLAFEFDLFETAKELVAIEMSEDLEIWEEIPLWECLLEAESLGNGHTRYTVGQKLRLETNESKVFFRLIPNIE